MFIRIVYFHITGSLIRACSLLTIYSCGTISSLVMIVKIKIARNANGLNDATNHDSKIAVKERAKSIGYANLVCFADLMNIKI